MIAAQERNNFLVPKTTYPHLEVLDVQTVLVPHDISDYVEVNLATPATDPFLVTPAPIEDRLEQQNEAS